MRLWSLHPSLLDTKGLVAAWREALLAQAVLRGQTVGYRNHPQLDRFKNCADPVSAINAFLQQLFLESTHRGYRFNGAKVGPINSAPAIAVTDGQVRYEFEFLKSKLLLRDPSKHTELLGYRDAPVNAVFTVVPGGIEKWEVVKG